MRKQTKLVAVLSAAALLAIGASMTSFAAAKGWTEENGEWVWLDSDDERVYNTWKKSGDNYYWLDEDGVMATNRLINEDDEAIYYVNEYGARVKNTWVSLENEDDEVVNNSYTDAEVPDTLWYYFGSNGKAYRCSGANGENWVKKTVDYAGGSGYFFFNSVGQMGSGWIEYDGNTYYCGDETQGYAHTWWQYLEPNADMVSGDYDDQEWFYFGSKGGNGKMTKASAGNTKTSYIGNRYYTFNDDGVLLTDWYPDEISTSAVVAPGKASGANVSAYADENGALGTGWVYAENEDVHPDESKWYYLVTISIDGKARRAVPFNSLEDNTTGAAGYRAKVIKGKTYLFDANGVMQTGLKVLKATDLPYYDEDDFEDGKTTVLWNGVPSKMLQPGTYFFEKGGYTSTAGQMKTGKVTVTDDGETFYYYFDKSSGVAVKDIVKDGVVYGHDGKRIQADDGNTNEIKTASYDIKKSDGTVYIPAGSKYIVSSTGKLRTSGKVTIDGIKYTIVAGVIDESKTEYVQ